MVPVSQILENKISIYFLTWKADVYKLRENPMTHTFSSRLVAVLKKGSSFGVRVFDSCPIIIKIIVPFSFFFSFTR